MQRSANQQVINTLLFQAITNNNLDKVKLYSEDPFTQICRNTVGDTPISHAARNHNYDIVKFLLSKLEKESAITQQMKTELGRVLLYCVGSNTLISERSSLVKQILYLGATTDAQSTTGYTSLHYAAEKGFDDIISMLLDAGADLNAKEKHGRVALEIAVVMCHEKCIEILSTYENKKWKESMVFALICFSDEKSLFNRLRPEVINKIGNFFPRNPFFQILSFLSQSGYENVSHRLTLISMQCALDAYLKIGPFVVPLDVPVPFNGRSQESIGFFSKMERVLSNKAKSAKEKAEQIHSSINEYHPKEGSNGHTLLRKFHLISSQSADTDRTEVQSELGKFHLM
jgi:hypothetical protein